jgi:hypothetical protein
MADRDLDINHLLPSEPEKLCRLADEMITVHREAIRKLQGLKAKVGGEFAERLRRPGFKAEIMDPSGEVRRYD